MLFMGLLQHNDQVRDYLGLAAILLIDVEASSPTEKFALLRY